jgi:hypothetical protein
MGMSAEDFYPDEPDNVDDLVEAEQARHEEAYERWVDAQLEERKLNGTRW